MKVNVKKLWKEIFPGKDAPATKVFKESYRPGGFNVDWSAVGITADILSNPISESAKTAINEALEKVTSIAHMKALLKTDFSDADIDKASAIT